MDVGVLPVSLSVMDCKVEILCFDGTDSTKKCLILMKCLSFKLKKLVRPLKFDLIMSLSYTFGFQT